MANPSRAVQGGGNGYIQLYGPAVANFGLTIASFFYLKSQISSIKTGENVVDQEMLKAILTRLDKLEGALQNLFPAVREHQQVLLNAGLLTPRDPPQNDGGDKGAKPKAGAKKAGAKPKGKKPVPKKKPAKAKPEPKASETEADLDDELDQILDEENGVTPREPDFELEETEAPDVEDEEDEEDLFDDDPTEEEKPKPKAKPTKPKSAPKKKPAPKKAPPKKKDGFKTE